MAGHRTRPGAQGGRAQTPASRDWQASSASDLERVIQCILPIRNLVSSLLHRLLEANAPLPGDGVGVSIQASRGLPLVPAQVLVARDKGQVFARAGGGGFRESGLWEVQGADQIA